MNRIALILAPGFDESEAAAYLSIFGWTRTIEGVEPIVVDPISTEREVAGAHGLVAKISILVQSTSAAGYAAAAIPGGFHEKGYSHATDEPILSFLRALDARGGWIASTSTGSRVPAAAGLLIGRRATTYPFSDGRHRAFLHECGATVEDGPIVVDGTSITGCSPWVAREVALELLKVISGERAVTAVRRAMGA